MKVQTIFGHEVDVDEAEAAALERQGLVAHKKADTAPGKPVRDVKVSTPFGDQKVPADEAAALQAEGLADTPKEKK